MQNIRKSLKIKSYTLAEAMMVIFVIGIIATVFITLSKPINYSDAALKKKASSDLIQINAAVKQILLKYSTNYKMTELKTLEGTRFSINEEGADEKLAALYKKTLGTRNSTVNDAYKNIVIKNESDENVIADEELKISDFTQGFKTKNGAYFALKLNNSCAVTDSGIYDPSWPDIHEVSNSCGLIFYDVNADESPNTAGVDIYIISIGKTRIN